MLPNAIDCLAVALYANYNLRYNSSKKDCLGCGKEDIEQ
jgi:hypothetical protein